MNSKNIITDRAEFITIMENLNNVITDVFIRMPNRRYTCILDSDLINMRLSDKPISIAFRTDNCLCISDSRENLFAINLDDFRYADIEDEGNEETYVFLKKPCKSISIWFKDEKCIVLYFWTDEKEN